jgi:hypothetical protein
MAVLSFSLEGRQKGKNMSINGKLSDFSAPLGTAEQGKLILPSGAEHLAITADAAMAELFRARFARHIPKVSVQEGTVTVRYRQYGVTDLLRDGLQRTAGEIVLNASILWTLEVRGGADELHADLRGLTLRGFDLHGDADKLELALPQPQGTVSIGILGDASVVTIRRPAHVSVGISVRGDADVVRLDDLHAVEGLRNWQTPAYRTAADRYDIHIEGDIDQLTLERYQKGNA